MLFQAWKDQLEPMWGRPWLRRGILGFLVLLAMGMAFLPGHVLLRAGRAQERVAYQTDMQRVVEAIQAEIQVLVELSGDWANWDDTYRFMEDRNAAYIKANLGWDNLWNNPKVHLMVFLTPEGSIHWSGFHPTDMHEEHPLPWATEEQRERLLVFLHRSALENVHHGFTVTPRGILLVAARPILTSTSTGPSRGFLIMGRMLDAKRLARIQERLRIAFTLTPDPKPGPSFQICGSNFQELILQQRLLDWGKEQQLLITLPWRRTQHQQTVRATLGLTLGLLVGVGSLSLLVLITVRLHTRDLKAQQATLESQVEARTKELKASEQQLRAFTDHTSDLMFWVTPAPGGQFRLEYVNPAAAPYLLVDLAEAYGRSLTEIALPIFTEPLLRNLETACFERHPMILEDAVHLPEGTRHYQSLFVPIQDEWGRVIRVVGSIRDITLLREREAALVQAQKLESLGVLAGGIAHDFNNLLTAATGNLEIVQSLMPDDPQLEAPFSHVQQALAKAANLTRQMLAYSGRGRFLIQTHDLNAAVRSMTALMEVTISKKARLEYALAPDLPPLLADGAQLQQVILNLILNASEALQGQSGSIRIATQKVQKIDPDGEPLLVPPEHPGPFVLLEVQDSGIGMTPEVMARIFEPFFTTKASGRGLGLSALLGILRGHQGGLSVTSQPLKGTCFRLFFPASHDATPLASAGEAESCRLAHGTILLLEDEEAIRTATAHLLRRRGLTVLEAANGLLGMEVYFAHRESLDAIVLDLTMPEMDGHEFLQELRPLAPTLPVLITSGFTEQAIEGSARDPHLHFLEKPYTAEKLTTALAALLPGS